MNLRRAALLVILLKVLPVNGQLVTVLSVNFNNGQWGSGWSYAGDVPEFVGSSGAMGLRLKNAAMQSVPVNVPPFFPMAFIPVPGGYSPQFAYELDAGCVSELGPIPGLLETGYAMLCWFDGTNVTGVLHYLGFNGTTTYSYSAWSSGNAPPATGTFGVLLAADVYEGIDPDAAAIFDDIFVHRVPYSAAADQIRFMLDGAFDGVLGKMRGDLVDQGLIQLTEPYTALGYPQVGGGGETTTAAVLNLNLPVHKAVDWVRLELRNATNPAQLVSTIQCLVLSNGSLLRGADGGPPFFPVPPGSYYVVVRHRNHLGVMTAAPVYLSATTGIHTAIDFRSASTATYGTDARRVRGSTMTLWPGDVNADHVVKYTGAGNDRDPILTAIGGTVPTATLSGQYRAEDVNLDGVVKYTGAGNDRDIILQTVGGSIPTNVRVEQVP